MLSYHHNGLGGESAVAVIEEVFERRPEEVNDENVVKTLLAKVVDIGNTGCDGVRWVVRDGKPYLLTIAYENLVGAVLVSQLGSVALSRFLF